MSRTLSSISEAMRLENERIDAERIRIDALIRRHERKRDGLRRNGSVELVTAVGKALEEIRKSWTTSVSGPFGLMSECYLTVTDAQSNRHTVLLMTKGDDMALLMKGGDPLRSRFSPAPDNLEELARRIDAMLSDEEFSSPNEDKQGC